MADIDVCAQMQSSIVRIPLAEGDLVEEGDTVVIVESMKMEVPITSPATGTVKEVLVSEGDTVGDGDVLLRIAPSTG